MTHPSHDSEALKTFSFPDVGLLATWNKLKKGWFDAKREASRQELIHRIQLRNEGYDRVAAEGTEAQRQMQKRLNNAKSQFGKCNKGLEDSLSLLVGFMAENMPQETEEQLECYTTVTTVLHEVLK